MWVFHLVVLPCDTNFRQLEHIICRQAMMLSLLYVISATTVQKFTDSWELILTMLSWPQKVDNFKVESHPLCIAKAAGEILD